MRYLWFSLGLGGIIIATLADIPMQGWRTQKPGQPTTGSCHYGLVRLLCHLAWIIEELQATDMGRVLII